MGMTCKALAFVAALAAVLSGRAGAEEMTVDPLEARALATRALHMGRPDLAVDIAGQILAQAPGDAEARLILAAAQAQMGQTAAAAREGKRAFQQADSPDLRFQAAYLTASALSAEHKIIGAKYWLRRADGVAQSASDSAALRRAYGGLDRRTPVRWSVSFSGGPSDNVNGGSLHDTFWAWGLPIPIAQALPGYSAQAQVKTTWRISETAASQLALIAAANTRQVRLSSRAYALSPGAKASDYESYGVDLGLTYRWAASEVQSFGIEALLAHRWLAGGQTSDSQRLKFSADRALQGGRVLALDLTAMTSQNSYSSHPHSASVSGNAALSLPLGKGMVTGSVGYDAVLSDGPGTAWRGPKLAVEYSPPALPGDIRLSLFGEVQAKDFWKTPNAADVVATAGASARFDTLSVMGFAPTLSVTSSRSRSDVVTRDTAETAVSLGLQSKF